MAQSPVYKLRFFFDPDSGRCFWAANDAARQKYGYPVDSQQLPVPENTRRQIDHLVYWYDTCIDWDYPAGPSPWDKDECRRFNAAVEQLLDTVMEQLGPEYEIVREFAPVEID